MSPTLAVERFCMHCGAAGPFRDGAALKCVDCDEETAEDRAEYQRDYQRARSAALRVLVKRHREEFDAELRAQRLKQKRKRLAAS